MADVLQDIEGFAAAFLKQVAPTLEGMVSAAVTKALPAAVAPAATAALDVVDGLISANNPGLATSSATAAPVPDAVATSATSVPAEASEVDLLALTARVSALEAHVAALTISSGAATSSQFQDTKASVQATQAAAVEAAKPAA